MCSWQIIDLICPLQIPKQISTALFAHIPSFVKIHWYLLVISWKQCWQITLSKIDVICPLAIPKQISTISMHKSSLVKIHWHLLKLSYGNENTDGQRDVWWMDGQRDRHMDSQHETIIPRHYHEKKKKKKKEKKKVIYYCCCYQWFFED